MKVGWMFFITLCIFLGSHFSVDRDFPKTIRNVVTSIMVVMLFIYVIFVIF